MGKKNRSHDLNLPQTETEGRRRGVDEDLLVTRSNVDLNSEIESYQYFPHPVSPTYAFNFGFRWSERPT